MLYRLDMKRNSLNVEEISHGVNVGDFSLYFVIWVIIKIISALFIPIVQYNKSKYRGWKGPL